MRWLRNVLVFIVAVFALFYLVTRPEESAAAVRGAFNALAKAFSAIIVFFTSLSK